MSIIDNPQFRKRFLTQEDSDTILLAQSHYVELIIHDVLHELSRIDYLLKNGDLSSPEGVQKQRRILDSVRKNVQNASALKWRGKPSHNILGVLNQITKPYKNSDVSITVVLDSEDLSVNAKLIRAVVGNLIHNTKSHGLREKYKVTITVHDGCIIYHDDGVGVAEENKEKIFEKGWSTRTKKDGRNRGSYVGMGLYLSRELLRSNGGDLLMIDDFNDNGRLNTFKVVLQ